MKVGAPIVAAALLALAPAAAPDRAPEPLRVRIAVVAGDAARVPLAACLTGTLGAIPDVVVDPKGCVVLVVVPLEQRAPDGDLLGTVVFEDGRIPLDVPGTSAGRTLWRGVRAVPPGHATACAVVERDFREHVVTAAVEALARLRSGAAPVRPRCEGG